MATPTTPHLETAPENRRGFLRGAAQAGALAAIAMLFVQLLWRLTLSPPGAPSLPEIVVAAVARLTPLALFGFATENFGSLAQNTLFVATLLGVIGVGYEAGGFAGRWVAAGRFGHGGGGRLAAGLAVAGVLLLVVLLIVAPLARLGVFAGGAATGGAILTQLVATFAFFGVAWALLAGPLTAGAADVAAGSVATGTAGSAAVGADGEAPRVPSSAGAVGTRRELVGRGAIGAGAVALLAGIGGMAWQLIRPRQSGDQAASQAAARAIAATAEARARARAAADQTPASDAAPAEGGSGAAAPGAAEANPTEVALVEAEATVPAGEVAQLPPPPAGEGSAPVAPTIEAAGGGAAADETLALFGELEAEGRLTPRLTSVADFYHVSKNISDPVVDGEAWQLTIDGLVETPRRYGYDEIVARATTRTITTLCCISNELNGDLVGTAEWTGLPLRDLLEETGVKEGAVDLKLGAADDYEDSIPVAQGLDPETLLVVAMNGEPLPPDNGYPARLIVPPIYGMKNLKWLTRIEAVDQDFQGYWQTRGWSDPAPYQIWGRIDTPRNGEVIPAGPAVVAGVASAGDRGISRVEVSFDDGQTWSDATLEPAINPPYTWVRWLFRFDATPADARVRIRATDGTGAVMSEQERSPLPDGATGWPERTLMVEG